MPSEAVISNSLHTNDSRINRTFTPRIGMRSPRSYSPLLTPKTPTAEHHIAAAADCEVVLDVSEHEFYSPDGDFDDSCVTNLNEIKSTEPHTDRVQFIRKAHNIVPCLSGKLRVESKHSSSLFQSNDGFDMVADSVTSNTESTVKSNNASSSQNCSNNELVWDTMNYTSTINEFELNESICRTAEKSYEARLEEPDSQKPNEFPLSMSEEPEIQHYIRFSYDSSDNELKYKDEISPTSLKRLKFNENFLSRTLLPEDSPKSEPSHRTPSRNLASLNYIAASDRVNIVHEKLCLLRERLAQRTVRNSISPKESDSIDPIFRTASENKPKIKLDSDIGTRSSTRLQVDPNLRTISEHVILPHIESKEKSKLNTASDFEAHSMVGQNRSLNNKSKIKEQTIAEISKVTFADDVRNQKSNVPFLPYLPPILPRVEEQLKKPPKKSILKGRLKVQYSTTDEPAAVDTYMTMSDSDQNSRSSEKRVSLRESWDINSNFPKDCDQPLKRNAKLPSPRTNASCCAPLKKPLRRLRNAMMPDHRKDVISVDCRRFKRKSEAIVEKLEDVEFATRGRRLQLQRATGMNRPLEQRKLYEQRHWSKSYEGSDRFEENPIPLAFPNILNLSMSSDSQKSQTSFNRNLLKKLNNKYLYPTTSRAAMLNGLTKLSNVYEEHEGDCFKEVRDPKFAAFDAMIGHLEETLEQERLLDQVQYNPVLAREMERNRKRETICELRERSFEKRESKWIETSARYERKIEELEAELRQQKAQIRNVGLENKWLRERLEIHFESGVSKQHAKDITMKGRTLEELAAKKRLRGVLCMWQDSTENMKTADNTTRIIIQNMKKELEEVKENLYSTEQALAAAVERAECAEFDTVELKNAIWAVWTKELAKSDNQFKRFVKGLVRVVDLTSRSRAVVASSCEEFITELLHQYRHQKATIRSPQINYNKGRLGLSRSR